MNFRNKSFLFSLIILGCILISISQFFTKRTPQELFVDFLKSEHPLHVSYEGIGPIEIKEDYRWAFGPSSTISFILSEDRKVLLTFQLSNPIPGQTLTIAANENVLKHYSAIPTQTNFNPWNSTRLYISGRRGINTITFSFGIWNQNGFILDSHDPRAFAMAFKELKIFTQ